MTQIGSDDEQDGCDADVAARLEKVVAAYLEAAAEGKTPDRDAILARHPDLAAALAEFFRQHDQLAELGSWWRVATGEASDATVRLDATRSAAAPLKYESPWPDLPGYEIRREIARGGMGVVYEARQASLDRPVAVKLLLHGQHASDADRRRFLVEAAAAAKLKHPHIVVVHEVGEHQGQPFFSMEYVEGENLARLVRRELPSPKQAAAFVADVARAVQFAHERGVLHRDIKPSNVLVDDAGRVRVMDFGLAKHVDADERLTVSGQLLGTPSYMAPEQIVGPAEAIGPACDVYALGALLYELVTGQPPFRGASHVETLLAALESAPPLPRRINPNVPRELELIALKCLEKRPEDRYASASAVAADIDRFLQGESLSVSSPRLLDRVTRTLERSQFDREVRAVSRALWYVAWIALATHAAVFMNYALGGASPLLAVLTIRLSEVAAMGLIFWPKRTEWFPPRGAAARQLCSIWLGYLAGSLVLCAVDSLMTPAGETYYGLRAYPPMAVLASLAFMLLGSSYWGYCYLIGALFLGLAVAMALWLPAAPLAFGVCWAASLILLARRLQRLATE